MISEENIIKVVVIDDSAFMRKSLKLMLESDPEIQVVGVARDGNEGLEKIITLKPDIVTLDIEMPGMDGLTALKIIMEQMPMPVLMVSSLTTESAQATLQAFDLGAIDFISKDLSYSSINIRNIKDELIEKVKQIAHSRLIRTRFRMRRLVQSSQGKTVHNKPNQKIISYDSIILNFNAIVIGVSTGGPQALLNIIPQIPEHFPLGVGIVQHMPPHFTKTLADRLDSLSKVRVKEAEHGEVFESGKVLIAPGGKQMTFSNSGSRVTVEISDSPPDIIYRPSANIMMTSAAAVFPGPLLGIIMTGMGKDGVEGLKHIKSKGGYVIGQNEESCVVYGMPRVALEEGLVDSMLSLDNIVIALERLAQLWAKARIPVGKGEIV
jgi:two-component system, chemotaxis family, protein-glutamate methylesterase/glutaminase